MTVTNAWKILGPLIAFIATLHAAAGATPSFADFDSRARAGQQLSVAFFGASLTWGANATDPEETSYRADVARKMEAAYPKAHFTFWDGAIGGTNSQLGVFRLDRDCLSHHPDLVFLDFSANDNIYSDDPETLASYESLVRRIIIDGHAPVVQMIFPFESNVGSGQLARMKRRDAHLALSRAYHTAVGDVIAFLTAKVAEDPSLKNRIWDLDGTHPGDLGYAEFADVAWTAYKNAVTEKLVCQAPDEMLFADTYMSYARTRISSLGPLPDGWSIAMPNRTSAWYDGLMSRWLDDEVVASSPAQAATGSGSILSPAPLTVTFRGSMVMLFGEETTKSGKYKAYIDGKIVTRGSGAGKIDEFDASSIRMGGNRQHAQVIAVGLDPNVDHTLTIAPDFQPGAGQELRLESICVAGGTATVLPFAQTAPVAIAPAKVGATGP